MRSSLQGPGGADPRHHVLALGVDQVVAIKRILPGARVPGEAHPGGGIVAHVAEDHGADVHRGAVGQIGGNVELAAIIHRPFTHPGFKYALDGDHQLGPGILGKRPPGFVLDELLKTLYYFCQGFGGQLRINSGVVLFLDFIKNLIEIGVRQSQADFAEKLQETAVGVIDEALILGQLDHAFGRFIIEPQIENGVHHSRHGQGGTGADRYQQGLGRVPEAFAGLGFQGRHVIMDFVHETFRELRPLSEIIQVGVGGDAEPRRHWQTNLGHGAQSGSLASQQLFIGPVAFLEGIAIAFFRCLSHVAYLLSIYFRIMSAFFRYLDFSC